ncbi:MAG: hypothetical protein K2M06_09240 [Muribaculaceae bacterium]|nr:hypothetical protein [Muribaculaceae bacterium]
MPQTLYYAQLDNEYFGPFALETLVGMHLTPDVSILSTETNAWLQACEYPELIDSLDLSLYEINEDDNSGDDVEPAEPNRIVPTFNEGSTFYICRGGNPYGPYTLEALASVSLSEETEVSLDGMTTWFKVFEIPGLLSTLEAIAKMANTSQETQQISQFAGHDNNEEISEILNRIQGLIPVKKQLFRRVFSTKEAELDFIISEYNRVFNTLLNLVNKLGELCVNASLAHRALALITSTVNDVAAKINDHYISEVERLNKNKYEFTTSSVTIGQTKFSLMPPLENIEISRIDFLNVLGDKNLCITYDEGSEAKALDFVNNIVGKLYDNNPARLIVTNVIDTDFMTGLDDSFKLLNRDLYKVVYRTDEVRTTLASLQERASTILRNLLVEKGTTLQDYNSTHENKEANILLILKNFPHGLNTENLDSLRKLANVGPKVGLYIIIFTSKEFIDEMSERDVEAFDVVEFSKTTNSYHFKDDDNDIFSILKTSDTHDLTEEVAQFEALSETALKKIVKEVNSKCELKEDVVVSFSEYLPEISVWWSSESSRQIDIPFGIGNDMQIKSLKITQESGQNTAVVIGIPGSGKSVFLHSLICSAAIKYSPDELRMYLIDFSGVEFNSYAIGKLPHARVIAPEAEREFGLSILNELVEEGSRRMALCRDHNVSNIVDLKRVTPGIKIPRLLVIIDEFQKLFEVDNDPIAKEANTKIHIIIQEFRKFGINLVLATQKLPTSSFLPRDLIANRVVFKSAPNDFDSLISSEDRSGMPRLRTGQCVYNSESGAAYANEIVQGFFTSKFDLDNLMSKIRNFEREFSYEREPLKVFRSADLPIFEERRREERHKSVSPIPYIVPVYFGESIAVSDIDVNVELVKENANNILIIGGEADIARNIAFNAMRSAVAGHNEDTAKVVVLSGMRADNPINEKISEFAASTLCDFTMVSSNRDVEDVLKALREEIDRRRNDETVPQQHIYVTCFDFQSIRALDRDTSGTMPKLSPAAKDMDFVIRSGASVGVFVIAQTDTLDALNRVSNSSPLSMFNFRVALQMSEDMSYKIVGTPLANKLFVFNRPSSRFRGYVRDNTRNLTVKFKPYK